VMEVCTICPSLLSHTYLIQQLQNQLRSVKQAHSKDRATLHVVTRELNQKSQELKGDFQAGVEEINRLRAELNGLSNLVVGGTNQHTPTTPIPQIRA
jgi:uncharacterized protein YoxC